MKTPSYDEIEEFLRIDGWRQVRSTGHDFFETTLPSGETLRSHTSFAGRKTMSAGRFKAILHDQLKISEDEFWEALRTRRPVPRPSPNVAPPPPSLPAWLWEPLVRDCGFSEEEVTRMTEDEAREHLAECRSRPVA